MARSVMGRTLFHMRGQYVSYIENSSKTSPSSVGLSRTGSLGMAQKLFNFRALRGGKCAAETGAFQRCGGRSEPKGLGQILIFGDGEGERAMKHVAGAQRIQSVHREGRRLPQVLVFVEPDRTLRTSRSRQKRRGQLRNLFERLAVVGDSGGLLQWLAREHQVRRPSRKDIARSTSTMTGMPRRRASTQRSVQNVAQRLSVRMASQSSSSLSVSGSWTFHSSGSRNVTMVRSPLGSIMMLDIGVTRPGICTMCLVSMPSCASFSKI